MSGLLLAVIYLVFISLGLPDSLLGSGWPVMQGFFGVPSAWAGSLSMTVSLMTILSALLSPWFMGRFRVQHLVSVSILLTVVGLMGFSFSTQFWMLFLWAVPYGLGAGCIDAAMNHYVANHYPAAVMNYLHCFYGVGAVISPLIMGQALRVARWNEGYRWTALVQLGILLLCLLSLPLWTRSGETGEERQEGATVREALGTPGVRATLIAFFAYCAGESLCFLWVPSYFAHAHPALPPETVAASGGLMVGGLTLGRLAAGLLSGRLGDRARIRLGLGVELMGLALLLLRHSLPAAVTGFVLIGLGMGPIYPAIQHMAPAHFGRRKSAAVIGLQMASAYTGSTFVPLLFGYLQAARGIGLLPVCLLLLATLTGGFLALSYIRIDKMGTASA